MPSKKTPRITESLRMQISYHTKTLIAILLNFLIKTMISDSREISYHRFGRLYVIHLELLKRKLIHKEE